MDEIAAALRCTYGGCETGDEAWMRIEGREGTPAEGKLAVLCETHTKMMTTLETDEEREAFAAKIDYVYLIDLGGASQN